MRQIHFISGLPRSGSTLLAGILRQNPRFHAEMTGPLGGVLLQAFRSMGPGNEFAGTISQDQKRRMLHGLVSGYYAEYPQAEVLFDTNRVWCSQLPLLAELFPDAKVIACVRNPAWIVDSLEQLHRRNPLNQSRIFGSEAQSRTVYDRAEGVLGAGRLLGFSLNALREAYYSDLANRLLLLEYDLLCQRPEQAVALIYQFLGEPAFAHDFSNVTYEAEAFDAQLDTPGLHDVSGPVRFQPRKTCLPPDLFDRTAALDFWRREDDTRAFRLTAQTSAQPSDQAAT